MSADKKGRKRPLIAFFCGNYHTDHPKRLVAWMYENMKSEDVDVRYYLQTESQGFLDAVKLEAARYDYQYASLPCYARYDIPDVHVISFGTILIYQKEWVLSNFLDVLPKAPSVVMECEADRPGCVAISVDNAAGMRMVTEHLIKEHHIQRPAFITGPMQNPEAQIRFHTFLDTCHEYGLDVPESRIVYGDFSMNIGPLVDALLTREPHIDALVSSNDEMARAAVPVLEKHGYVVGKDILLTGFDNAIFARQMNPPLTTVDQNYPELVRSAAVAAMDLIEGKESPDVKVPPILRARESCGCADQDQSLEEEDLLVRFTRQEENFAKSWSNALLLREALLRADCLRDFLKTLGQKLGDMGCTASWICLLEEPVRISDGGILEPPAVIRLALSQEGENVTAWDDNEGPVCEDGGTMEFLDGERPRQTFTYLLFYQDIQYGTFTVECTPEEASYYYGMSLEIGTGIMVQHLLEEQRNLLQDLRDKNQVLDFEAEHDNLTGLYNRAALISRALSMVRSAPDRSYAVVMADLDHLKQINDTFGHIEGDFAIKKSAQFLRDSLPDKALIGRIGGDEFLAFFPADEETVKASLSALQAKIRSFEHVTKKPYYVDISCGYMLFDAKMAGHMQELINGADLALYEAKKARRESVIRHPKE